MPHASVNAISLYYEETGQGDAIVSAHELSDDCRSFAHRSPTLRRGTAAWSPTPAASRSPY